MEKYYRWTGALAEMRESGSLFVPSNPPLGNAARYWRIADGSVMAEELNFGMPTIYIWDFAEFCSPRHHQDIENPGHCYPNCQACRSR